MSFKPWDDKCTDKLELNLGRPVRIEWPDGHEEKVRCWRNFDDHTNITHRMYFTTRVHGAEVHLPLDTVEVHADDIVDDLRN